MTLFIRAITEIVVVKEGFVHQPVYQPTKVSVEFAVQYVLVKDKLKAAIRHVVPGGDLYIPRYGNWRDV